MRHTGIKIFLLLLFLVMILCAIIIIRDPTVWPFGKEGQGISLPFIRQTQSTPTPAPAPEKTPESVAGFMLTGLPQLPRNHRQRWKSLPTPITLRSPTALRNLCILPSGRSHSSSVPMPLIRKSTISRRQRNLAERRLPFPSKQVSPFLCRWKSPGTLRECTSTMPATTLTSTASLRKGLSA